MVSVCLEPGIRAGPGADAAWMTDEVEGHGGCVTKGPRGSGRTDEVGLETNSHY